MQATWEDIAAWCREYVAELLETPVESVDPDADFDRLGIDSSVAVSLLIEVEERYGVDLPPEALFENPSLNALAAHLEAESQRRVAQP